MMKQNVVTAVVQQDLCIGCGICAGVCPANSLTMEFNRYGEYNPVGTAPCPGRCSLCLQVCPFNDRPETEDDLARLSFDGSERMHHRPETGYYRDAYAGHSAVGNHRANGSSGGMATWLLETLLRKGIVSRVICVTPNPDPERLFRFASFDDVETIRRCAKSAYYPVELSSVIREVLASGERYAVTGLPCFLKGLRLAQMKQPRLRERIAVTVGLVCGQMKSKHYTTYVASLAGVDGRLRQVDFRGKSLREPAANFFFSCVDERNREGRLFWREGVREVWAQRWFTPHACNFCDDVFAETADVALMDAWLPETAADREGSSLVLSRSPLISDLVKEGTRTGELHAGDVPIDMIIQSQREVLRVKRAQLAFRLYQAKEDGVPVPMKRTGPSGRADFLSKREIRLKDRIRSVSREVFLKYRQQEKLAAMSRDEELGSLIRDLRRWERIRSLVHMPGRVAQKTRRMLLGR